MKASPEPRSPSAPTGCVRYGGSAGDLKGSGGGKPETKGPAILLEARSVSKWYCRSRRPLRRLAAALRGGGDGEEGGVWALREAGLAVAPGECVGVLGENGSGKSTLLRVLAGLTAPSAGEVRVRGEVEAVLELAAGFHPEATGRENAGFGLRLRGVPAREAPEAIRAIEAFAGLAEAFDAPLRAYSSGMVVRLGVSLATWRRPAILLLDEALSAGDLGFQRRAVERVEGFLREGSAVILATHDLRLLERIASRAVRLSGGRIARDGPPSAVASEYQALASAPEAGARPRGGPWISSVRLAGDADGAFRSGGPFRLRIGWAAPAPAVELVAEIAAHREDGLMCLARNVRVREGGACVEAVCEALPLPPGRYALSVTLFDAREVFPYDHHARRYPFEVLEGAEGNRSDFIWKVE